MDKLIFKQLRVNNKYRPSHMMYYRITKYNPMFRNQDDHYMYEHWTEFSDIGKYFEGELLTRDKYLTVESDYINAVKQILIENKVEYLRLVGFNKKHLNNSIKENKGKWFHRLEYETTDLFEDKKVTIDEIEIICQMNFRYYCNVSLEINNSCYIHFGYDMYMYVGVNSISDELLNKLNTTSIFIENGYSPYFYEQLEYVLERSKKKSKYILDVHTLKNISINQMKKVMSLSDEHTGVVNRKINKKIAKELNLKVDFDKYVYYINTENIFSIE